MIRRFRVRRIVTRTLASGRGGAVPTVLDDTEEVEALLASKYGWTWRGYTLVMAAVRRLRRHARPDSVTITITLR